MAEKERRTGRGGAEAGACQVEKYFLALGQTFDGDPGRPREDPVRSRGETERMSSVVKKRRKKIRKHKYKKLRRQSRHKKK